MSASVKYDVIMGNPPFGKDHLKIIDSIIPLFEEEGVGCFIHPARWYEDPLAEHKRSADKVKYKSIVERLDDVRLLDNRTSESIFVIIKNGDLMISTVRSRPTGKEMKIYGDMPQKCVDVILSYAKHSNLGQVVEKDKVDGWRVQVKEMTAIDPHLGSMTEYDRKGQCNLFGMNKVNVFKDGYYGDVEWMETRRQTKGKKSSGAPIPLSIQFKTRKEAVNFEKSCNTKFYNNILYLLKLDMHTPVDFLPWMGDYSHSWTDKDYCEFFGKMGMDKECQKWMCRDVYDYRTKDFIKYDMVEAA